MTPQEEQLLVQIIVQCVRAVLETIKQETIYTQPVLKQGSRFIDVVPQREINNANALRNDGQNGHGREDVRESLRRFLRDSEPAVPIPERIEVQQEQPQKRQLITREDVLAALRQGIRVIALQPDAVVTPLARQVAKEKGIELR
jgi:hypothetical protein